MLWASYNSENEEDYASSSDEISEIDDIESSSDSEN